MHIADVDTYNEIDLLLASMSSALISIDENDIVQRWNPAAEETFGIFAKDVIGLPFLACGIDWNWMEILTRIDECRTVDTVSHWEDIPYKNCRTGVEGFLNVNVNPIVVKSQRHKGFILLAQDMTEKKNMETQINEISKLESIGELAAGIAHEINTPIQYVGDNTRFLHDAFLDLKKLISEYAKLKQFAVGKDVLDAIGELEEELDLEYLLEEVPLALDQTKEGVDRVAHIVKAMKDFSHPGNKEKALTDINKAIENTVIVTRNEWKYVAELKLELLPNMPNVPCLIGELNQVFVNMIVNAAHAVADVVEKSKETKGLITISTAVNDNNAEIRISDSGCGISTENVKKIFNPFFTTKEVGRGSGQGLAISHNVIVNKHGGSIDVESQRGKGTTFVITLPLESGS